MREHEKGTPLYVLCRKWVQNEPDTELMPPRDRFEESATREREAAAAKLPAIPPQTEEELAKAEPPLEVSERDPPTIEVRLPD